jgi:MFS family permease
MSTASWSTLFQGRRAAHTLLLTLGVGVHAVDVFIVATVLPSVVADIGGAAFYTWATMLYIVASILGTASGALLRAMYGMRGGYLTGALVFLAGSIGCAVAPHMLVLLGSRTLQGLGGGALVALSYSMVSTLYTEELRPRILSAVSGVWGAAALLGPLVGGVFAEFGWWRGAFWIALPVVIVLLRLLWRTLPSTERVGTVPHVPLLRLTLLGTGVLCVAWSGHIVSLGMRLVLIGCAGILVMLTFRLDAGASHRLFPSQPLSLRTPVGTATWIFFLFGVMASQVSVFLPLVVQVLHGVSPLGAGYFSALRSLAWTAAALCSAGLQGRGVRRAILSGPLVLTCGVVGQALVVVNGSLFLLGSFVVLTGVGIGLCFAHISSWSMTAARPGEEERTASCIPMAQSLGIAFGAATAGVVANMAGLAAGVSPFTVAAAATWVYGLSTVAPAVITGLAFRFLWLHRVHPSPLPRGMRVPEGADS